MKDYNACLVQNGDEFGYIPLTDLKTYQGPAVQWQNPFQYCMHISPLIGRVGCQF